MTEETIGPQPGPQYEFLCSDADICLYGGAAGGGKTYAMLLDFLRWDGIPGVYGTFFRRTMPQILNPGGLWDTSLEIYPHVGAREKQSPQHSWTLDRGSKLVFSQLEHEKTVNNYQGAQIAVLYFDELTHFSRRQFMYMLSRNRSARGNIRPYVRATCNPEKNSFVRELVDPWIGQDGFVDKERTKKIFYMYNVGDQFFMDEDKDKLRKKFPHMPTDPKSIQFVPARVEDNKILMKNDPGYLANLMSLNSVDRAKLYGGNWNVSEESGDYFKREYFEYVDRRMLDPNRLIIRFWDRAGTSAAEVRERKQNPDTQAETASVKLSFHQQTFYVEDVTADMLTPNDVASRIMAIAQDDGPRVTIGLSQDPGQAGKFELEFYKNFLAAFHKWEFRETGSKTSRSKPVSAKAERGKLKLVRAAWNEKLIEQSVSFPAGKKDIMDALSGAFAYFVSKNSVSEYAVKNNAMENYAKGLSALRSGKYQF